MASRRRIAVDGNEAAASVAYRASEVIAIYPITPASNMGEFSDSWSVRRKANLWGGVPQVVEMQSEAGAAGAVHGALQAGSLSTTFTASQGLLLMIPNMYKIAGELTPFVLHVAARAIATHALSIFGDHSDVMACRGTGFAMLASGSVQEAQDMAAVAHGATLRTRVPFLHFFDGFRTSHEVNRIEEMTDDDLRAVLDDELVRQHRERALTPERPVLRGTAQNPDAYFQAREAGNPFYLACPGAVQDTMDRLARQVGRAYHLFDYVGHPEAERVIVMMGSGAETTHETVDAMVARGEKVGAVKVRLYRPFSVEHFLAALPRTARFVAVLDRTKEPGAIGEPLFLDVVAALAQSPERAGVRTVGGRYGLASKEFTPAMVQAVYDELSTGAPRHPFTVGINDDVTRLSLPVDTARDAEPEDVKRAVFFGLGADGTVSANKNSVKIIAEEADAYAQGYFVYDSKKSGSVTISHLRFGPRPIRSSYLVRQAQFVACHQFELLERHDVLDVAAPGATILLNAPFPAEEVWDKLPRDVQAQALDKGVRLFTIDALAVAKQVGIGGRINTVMQSCFFALSGVLPKDDAIARIKKAVEKTYTKAGAEVIKRNFAAIDAALEHMHEVPLAGLVASGPARPPLVPAAAPEFVQRVTAMMIAGRGDLLPVSALPVDGTWPMSTTQWEKRNLADEIPVWDAKICIQCNHCVMACPHAAIRAKVYPSDILAGAPGTFVADDFKSVELKGLKYTLQVAPEDCTGCGLCVEVCPAKDKSKPRHKAIDMAPQRPLREAERANFEFFLGIPEMDRTAFKRLDVKTSQLLQPLFEFSGACSGCGETPYVKLLTQLFGDRSLVANATGCSSIYGGNLPTTPYCTNTEGRGPAWNNSLFEDNAEFGFGMRLALDAQQEEAARLLRGLSGALGDTMVEAILGADQSSEAGLRDQRERVAALKGRLAGLRTAEARRLHTLADSLVKKSVWLVGGDGWAYDIGYGGLDHVLASRRDVNVLVLDTEVYSNTGGQQSKATPMGAAAKFAEAGKDVGKKDLGLLAMSYGHVYVARVAFGAKNNQTVQAFLEADAYPGPSLIIAYSHCIAHGYDMRNGADQQKLAVESGLWPLFRFDPRRLDAGLPPLHLDSGPPKARVLDYMRNEARFLMVERQDAARFQRLAARSQVESARRYALYQQLSAISMPIGGGEPGAGPGPGKAEKAPEAKPEAEPAVAGATRRA